MPIPDSRMKERLSVAYVKAVAARAGTVCREEEEDYGIDVEIRRIVCLPNGKYRATGTILHGQLKATTTSYIEDDNVVYDMEAEAYNKLVEFEDGVCLLILFCLPQDDNEWLSISEDQLLLKRCCYWEYFKGDPCSNRSTKRIKIPRQQLFDANTICEWLQCIKDGRF